MFVFEHAETLHWRTTEEELLMKQKKEIEKESTNDYVSSLSLNV